ncbi:MAG: glycoside hydrolase family 127 protein [Planctomycetia bacterium]|nr:glycoside hydrolase family 127 protein [Planctomycetia bacterium]
MSHPIMFCFSIIVALAAALPLRAQEQRISRVLNPVPFTQVEFTDSFWAPRIAANREVSVPHNIDWCENQTARINNFRIAAGDKEGKFQGIYFDDSDVYKILEGFAYTLSTKENPALHAKCEEWIDLFERAQCDDGYLMCWFQLEKPQEKWTNLASMHELYCAGHMTEAAVAYTQATGDEKFLTIVKRLNDLICKRYGNGEGQLKNVPGHEEIELALIKLYEQTGDKKYLDQAKFFVDIRGVAEGRETPLFGAYSQDNIPVREMNEVVGHAVRAMYLMAGATDVAGYFKDENLMAAMERVWDDMVLQKMYITGGIGSLHEGEAFGPAFFLPNQSAYAETCAAIGVLLWAHRMNLATGNVQYANVANQALYNGVLSGYGLNGDSYFYVNPLASNGDHHRQPFFGCACCPSNIIRTLASLPGYAYCTTQSESRKAAGLTGDDTVVVNMYVDSKATIELAIGTVELVQKTDYPFDGKISISAKLHANPDVPADTPWGLILSYGQIGTPYYVGSVGPSATEQITLETTLPMPVERMVANPKVEADLGRVALKRGPLVYCFEQCDNDVPVDEIVLAKDPEFKVEMRDHFISSDSDNEATKNSPMRTVAVITCKNSEGQTLTAIPYYAWDNRAPGKMAVWVKQDGLNPADDSEWTDEKGKPILYKPLNREL